MALFPSAGKSEDQLLTTKLFIPIAQPGWVARQQLIDRINNEMQHALTMISAPAGFGKTTLLSEWAQSSDTKVAWVSLDISDNQLSRFWMYCIAAIQIYLPGICTQSLALLHQPTSPSFEFLLTTLINELAASIQPLALVLDDYHLIENHEIHQSIQFLLDHIPPNLHLVLATRSDPPLAITRLRARNMVTEIRARDLRFSFEESIEFFKRVTGGELSINQVKVLEERTEGWVTGLQLAALSIQGREEIDGFIQSFSGSNTFILDYLAEEVLQQLPGEWVPFLLDTSILGRLSAPLCDAITGHENSQPILEQLHHANLFLFPLDSERRWYRYHHLFADFLRSRLIHQDKPHATALHGKASHWFAENGFLHEAVQHALAAQDFDRVAGLIEPISLEAGRRSDYQWIAEWAGEIPESVLQKYPELCYWYAWALVATGQVEKVDRLLQLAETAWKDLPANLGKLLSVRCNIALLRGQISETIAYGEHALQLLAPNDHYSIGGTLVPMGGAYLRSGQLDRAESTLSQAIVECQAGKHYMSELYGMNLLADTFLEEQALEKAEIISQQILNKIGNQLILHKGKALIRLGEIALAKGEANKGLNLIREGIQFRQNIGMERYQAQDYAALGKALAEN